MSKAILAASLCAVVSACGTMTSGSDAGTAADAGGDCSQQMFAKYGAAGFTAVNTKIIEKALAAPTASVGTSFQGLSAAQKTTLSTNLAAFLIQAYGGPKNYAGKSMKAAHMGLMISEAQYNYFVSNAVVPALMESTVAAADITNCFAPAVTNKAAGSVLCDTVEPKAAGCP